MRVVLFLVLLCITGAAQAETIHLACKSTSDKFYKDGELLSSTSEHKVWMIYIEIGADGKATSNSRSDAPLGRLAGWVSDDWIRLSHEWGGSFTGLEVNRFTGDFILTLDGHGRLRRSTGKCETAETRRF